MPHAPDPEVWLAFSACRWASVGASGGPWIQPETMLRLGALGLPLLISGYAVDPA